MRKVRGGGSASTVVMGEVNGSVTSEKKKYSHGLRIQIEGRGGE